MGKRSIDTLRLHYAHARNMEDRSYSRMIRVSNTFTKWFLTRRKLEDEIETLETEATKIAERLTK